MMEGLPVDVFVDQLVRPVRAITDRQGKGWRSMGLLLASSVVGGEAGGSSGGSTRRFFGRSATARLAGSSWLAPKAKLAAMTARRGQNSTASGAARTSGPRTGPFGSAQGAARGAALLKPRM